jgi:hypothetical protein
MVRKQSLEESMYIMRGNEPTVSKDTYKSDLVQALNWYNFSWEEKDYRKAAEMYIKKTGMKEYMNAISKASFLEIRPVGVLGRLSLNNQHVELNDMETIISRLEYLKSKYAKVNPVVDAQPSVAPVSIQDRIVESARTHAAEIDGAVDEFMVNKGTSFSTKSYMVSSQVSGVVAKKVGDLYKPLLEELKQVNSDDQLKEGYSHLSKIEMRKLIAFVQSIIDDCNQQVVSSKTQRKPRARKAKPASVIVNKMKYMREYPALGLKSVEAAKIIGAAELWVYVPQKRKLIVYRAADGHLGVSGMSITNYDTKTSEVKTLRKPEEFFKGLSMGKRAMANAWKGVRAKTSSPRSRINEEMLLLAVN